jgi:hypothetical protein
VSFKKTSAVSIESIPGVVVTALVPNVDSIEEWVAAGFFVVGALVILMQFGKERVATMSRNIHEASR